ncbi:membrane protein [Clostridium acetobutylicum]|nr:membrane protein [Clostridium acetobutylicum]
MKKLLENYKGMISLISISFFILLKNFTQANFENFYLLYVVISIPITIFVGIKYRNIYATMLFTLMGPLLGISGLGMCHFKSDRESLAMGGLFIMTFILGDIVNYERIKKLGNKKEIEETRKGMSHRIIVLALILIGLFYAVFIYKP